jgi:hypothetical protein
MRLQKRPFWRQKTGKNPHFNTFFLSISCIWGLQTFLYFSLKGGVFAGKEGFLLSKVAGNRNEKVIYSIVCMRFFSKAGILFSPNYARKKKNYARRKKNFSFYISPYEEGKNIYSFFILFPSLAFSLCALISILSYTVSQMVKRTSE